MSLKPLDGITVLDFSHALAGPYCTMIMAMYGARVIKVESPDQGDMGRLWGPPFQGPDAAYFVGLNSEKQSLAIDLKKPEGLAICKGLADKADILIENFRPGTMARLGFDYESLAKTNPRLIYVSVSGYGQTGPRKNEPAMDLIIQASSGLMSITGTPGGETVRTGHSVADITAGMFALIGAQMALEARHKTGRGQFVDVSMIDTLVSTMAPSYARFLATDILPTPMGTKFDAIVPYRNFKCQDREVTMAVASDKLWEGFCKALERPDLINHQDYNSNPLRVKNRKVLEPLLEEIFLSKPAAHWMEAMLREGTPCTLVRNLREVVDDEQTQARGMVKTIEHGSAGPVRVTGVPVQLSETPGEVTKAAPLLGADSADVLRDVLGYPLERIASLMAARVISQPPVTQ
jgi:crotonobetainyl-CoA:carnitine CoA-transferase CaiB-like acyl-CoA transferase